MHRAHDPRVETPGAERYHLGRKTLRRKYARRFWYTPFAVGAALIWGAHWGVKRNFALVLRRLSALKKPVKPIVFLCLARLSGINM